MFRFMHCADLHLGSRFKGLDALDPKMAERLRRSVFDSFSRIIDRTLESRCDALVISGDIFDDQNELPSTRMWFCQQLSRLRIPVFICRGNHDSKTTWDSSIPYPDNVHEFGTEPERFELDSGVEVIGVSFQEVHERRNLASLIQGTPDKFTIACIHCDVDSYSEGYAYAPCSVTDLRGRAVDYWALGHIHKRAVVSENPYAVYPGNIQGRSFKETGQKGAYLVSVDGRNITSCEFISTQGYVWKDISLDVSGKDMNWMMGELHKSLNRSTISRLTLTGQSDLDMMLRLRTDDVRKTIADSTGAILSELIIKTSPEVDMASMSEGKHMGSAVIREGAELSELSKQEIIDMLCENRMLKPYRDRLMEMTEDELRSLIDDATRNVIARMGAGQ